MEGFRSGQSTLRHALAGIQKSAPDASLRRYDERIFTGERESRLRLVFLDSLSPVRMQKTGDRIQNKARLLVSLHLLFSYVVVTPSHGGSRA
jgi:hypothetical protein